jgi:hypothetical protein
MCVKIALAYQPDRAGFEHKINKLLEENTVFNAYKSVFATALLGPDS